MGVLKMDDTTVEKYVDFLKNLDNRSKKKLIIALTNSIDELPVERMDIADFKGVWEDDRSAEEIIEDIRKSRTPNQEIEAFE